MAKKKTEKKKLPALKPTKAKLWAVFSEYIRRKDADDNGYVKCVTCTVVAHWKNMQAGHAIPGRNNAVLFDEDIVHTQCFRCNVHKKGNLHIYVTIMIRKLGLDNWERKLERSNRTVKFTVPDLLDKIEYYKTKVRGK